MTGTLHSGRSLSTRPLWIHSELLVNCWLHLKLARQNTSWICIDLSRDRRTMAENCLSGSSAAGSRYLRSTSACTSVQCGVVYWWVFFGWLVLWFWYFREQSIWAYKRTVRSGRRLYFRCVLILEEPSGILPSRCLQVLEVVDCQVISKSLTIQSWPLGAIFRMTGALLEVCQLLMQS